MQLEPGTVLAERYRAERLLGRGGMGEVWLCRDLDRDVDVAIKSMRPDVLRDEEAARLFHGEVVAAARLCHPGIVAVYDLLRLRDEGTFLVMAYRPGRSLGASLGAPVRFSFVCEVLRQVLAALAYAHARGVLHLDIKPDNVILETAKDALRATLVDFGIARVRTPGLGIEKWLRRDTVMGTLAYMAPEQCAGRLERFGPWTDLYAIGAMGYELCAGEPPYVDTGGAQAIFERLTKPAPRLTPVLDDVPRAFVDLCDLLLMNEPSARPTHAADVLSVLDRIAPAGPIEIPQPGSARSVASDVATADRSQIETAEKVAETLDVYSATGFAASEAVTARMTAGFAATVSIPNDRARAEAALERAANLVRSRSTASLARGAIGAQLAASKLAAEPEPEPGSYGLFGLRELPLVGREQERESLWRALRDVVLDKHIALVLLEGPAGAGKSRVARDALERSHELGLCVTLQTSWSMEGSGDEGLRGLIENLLDSRGAPKEGVRRRLSFFLERCPGDHAAFMREVELLLRPPPEAAPDAALPVRVALDAIARAASQRPVLLWLDDVQWARGQALELLRALAAHEPRLPVLIVATAREEDIEDRERYDALRSALGEGHASRVVMTHLDPHATRRLVRGLLDVDDALADFLAGRAEGNPLFLTQLLAELVRAEAVKWSEGRYRLSKAVDLNAVPADIGALWQRRVERSGADARLLAAIALTRERVSREIADELARCMGEDLEPAIERALEHGLLSSTGGTYGWVHGLLRDHLIATLTDRTSMHAIAARALAPLVGREDVQEERARHLYASDAVEEACNAMLDAIIWSERRAENDARKRRAEAMIAWSEEAELPEYRVRALAELGHALVQTGHGDTADHRIADAIAIAERLALDVPWLHFRRGQVAKLQGRNEDGDRFNADALRAAREARNAAVEANATFVEAIAAQRRGATEAAVRGFECAIELFRRVSDPHGESRALCWLADMDAHRGLDLFARALDVAASGGALSAELTARYMRSDLLWKNSRVEEAWRDAADVAAGARRRGLRQLWSLTELQCAKWAIETEDFARAEHHLAEALKAGADRGASVERALTAAVQLVTHLSARRFDEARSALSTLIRERGNLDIPVLRTLVSRAIPLAPPDLHAQLSKIFD